MGRHGSRIILLGALVGLPALAQSLVQADRVPSIKRALDAAASGPQLRCVVHPVRPALDYGFRFSTGFTADVPLSQLRGLGHGLDIYLRVTPEGKPPVYLTQRGNLTEVPDTKAEAEVVGTFIVGEGSYNAEVLVQDEQHRSCRSAWPIQVRRSGSERQLSPATRNGVVDEAGSNPALVDDAVPGPRIGTLSILLHAAPQSPNLSKLQPADIERLVDSLLSVMRELPAQSVRLVAFNLDQHAVMFRKEGFEKDQKSELVAALNQMKLGMVDYRTLRQNPEPGGLLAKLIETELDNAKPPDGLIVLGPRTRTLNDVAVSVRPGVATAVFNLQLLPTRPPFQKGTQRSRGPVQRSAQISGLDTVNSGVTGADGTPMALPTNVELGETADSIQRLVSHLKGETVAIRTPHDLADAIRRMDVKIAKTAAPVMPATKPSSEAEGHVDQAPVAPTPSPASASVPSTPSAPASISASAPAPSSASAPGSASASEPVGDEDPVEVLMHLRDQILEHGERVPNHTCVETIKRDRYEPVAGRAPKSCSALLDARKEPDSAGRLKLDSTDWLRLDVAFSTAKEIYSWAGANKFEDGDIDELVPQGALGTGAYAGLLLSIFAHRDQRFLFEGETTVDGRRVFEYSYAVSKEVSRYRFKARKEWMITGYSGSLLIDPKKLELVRVVVRTEELPPVTETCESNVTLEFGVVKLEGADYLLPTVARQRFIGRQGAEDENRTTFSSCRQFQAESKLAFGDETPTRQHSESGSPVAAQLPPGLPVSVELMTTVRVGESAAGDRIEGRLAKPIQDGQQKTLAPEGALVQGRLMRVETAYSPRVEHSVSLRWESVEIDGGKVPLTLAPNRRSMQPTTEPMTVSGPKTLKRRGMEIVLPLPSEGGYAVVHLAESQPMLEKGYKSEWLTAKP